MENFLQEHTYQVSELKNVDLPTFGRPTIPIERAIIFALTFVFEVDIF